MKHVVIVGGGFAGLNCARKLAAHSDIQITLIDKNNFQQFQPLLYRWPLPSWRLAMRRLPCATSSRVTPTWM